jgi:hypothetical protein
MASGHNKSLGSLIRQSDNNLFPNEHVVMNEYMIILAKRFYTECSKVNDWTSLLCAIIPACAVRIL